MQVTPPVWKNQRQPFRLVAGQRIAPESTVTTQKVIYHVKDWIVDAEYNRMSPRTIEIKTLALERFIWWLNETSKTEITPYDIKAYIGYLTNSHNLPAGRWGNPRRSKQLSVRAVEVYFINLRTYFRWLVNEGILADSPVEGITVPKPKKPNVRPFTPDHVLLLLDAARRTTAPARDVAIVSLMIDTGIRASELCGIRLRDLTMNKNLGNVTVRGKGDKVRTVPFDTDATRAIWRHLRDDDVKPDDFLFTGNRGLRGSRKPLTRSGLLQFFERLETMTGITDVRVSPHTCRHTFAIEFLRRGGNLLALQLMLGHEKLEMVQTYAKLASADLENQHRASSPLAGILKR